MFDHSVENGKLTMIIHCVNLVILIRVLRMNIFLNELQIWKNFIRALNALSKPFYNLTMTICSWMFLYSAIGGTAFGGIINTNSIVTI